MGISKDYSVPSAYFGLYFLDKKTQKKYLVEDEDKIPELRFDLFDKDGWKQLKISKEYKSIMEKSDKKTWEKAYELLKENTTINTMENPRKNENVTEVFASNLEIITNPGGLPITLRTSTMKSKTMIEAKQTKNGYYVYILKHYKLYDEFKQPYNVKIKNGKIVDIIFLNNKETGLPYSMSSGYRDSYIYQGTFKNREEALKFLKGKAGK